MNWNEGLLLQGDEAFLLPYIRPVNVKKNQFHSSGVDRGIRVISCPPSRHTPTSYCIIQFSLTIIDLGNVCFTGFLMDVSFSSIATFILVLIENSSLFVIKAFKIQGNPFFTHMTGIHANFVVFCMTVFSHFHYSSYRERLMRCVTAHIYTGGDSS